MPDEDILTEGGPEPIVEPEAPDAAGVEAPEVDAPITFTAEQLAEHLPQFQERFLAHHDPAEALALYGQRDRNVQAALTRYTQGAPTDEDVETLRESGYEIPEAVEQVEEPMPLWGAPWNEPTDYDSFVALANTRPDKAMEFIDKQPAGVIDADTRQQVLNYWAQHDAASAIKYEQEQGHKRAADEAKAYADERYAELEQRMTPLQERASKAQEQELMATATMLAVTARDRVPDFANHEDGVVEILKENVAQDPTYLPRLLALPIEQQLIHMSDLTGAAAWRKQPAEVAAAAEAEAATKTSKITAAGERGRSAPTSNGDQQSEAKKRHVESFQRLKDAGVIGR